MLFFKKKLVPEQCNVMKCLVNLVLFFVEAFGREMAMACVSARALVLPEPMACFRQLILVPILVSILVIQIYS